MVTDMTRRLRWQIAALAIAEIIVWASFFYLFPALLSEWQRELGWSLTELTGAMTLALCASALFSPIAGKLIDHGWGRLVLTASTFAGGTLLIALSWVEQIWTFYLIWFAVGVAIAGSLYEPCFAWLTRQFGIDARKYITAIALIGGLAGTLAFPGANALVAFYGWRWAVWVFGVAACLIGAPLMWFGATTTSPPAHDVVGTGQQEKTGQSHFLRSPVFWLLAFAFSMLALDHGLILTHILPLLDEKGIPKEAAVLAAAMIGPMQVTGRLAMMAVQRYVSISMIFSLAYIFMAVASLALYGSASVPFLLAGFVLLQGSGFGVTSITRPTVTLQFLGHEGFGTISGALALPYMFTFAFAPTIAALIRQVGGYDLVIATAFIACLLGLMAFLAAVMIKRRS